MSEQTNKVVEEEVKPVKSLGKRISYALFFTAKECNPNGDPMMGNQPRQNIFTKQGYVSAECIKHKVRNRLMWMNEPVLVQPDAHPLRDDYSCINARAKAVLGKGKSSKERKSTLSEAFTDVRLFGCTIADSSVPVSLAGPITMSGATSIDPVMPFGYQLTKSTNGSEPKAKDGKGEEAAEAEAEAATAEKKSSETMGYRERIYFGLYMTTGSVTPETARATGLTYEDMHKKFKPALLKLFEGDATSARPAGSMEVCKLVWWESDGEDNGPDISKLARTIQVKRKDGVTLPSSYEDYEFTFLDAEGKPEADQSVCTIPGVKREIIECY